MPTPLPIYPDVNKYQNGQRLDAETMNVPISQLEKRTDWLYSRLGEFIGSQNRASVRISNVEIETGAKVGDCVYFDPVSGLFCRALARTLIESSPFYVSAMASLVVGMLSETHQSDGEAHSFGTIVLSGLIDFGSLADVQALVESGIEFKSGPYYLSSKEPGKITPNPSGPAIYIGMFVSDDAPGENSDSPAQASSIPSTAKHGTYALLAPQYKDLAEMHHHRAFILSGNVQTGISSSENPDLKLYVSGTYTGTQQAKYSVKIDYSRNLPITVPNSWDKVKAEWIDLVTGETGISDCHIDLADGDDVLFSLGGHGLIGRLQAPNDSVRISDCPFTFGSLSDPQSPAFTTDDIRGWTDYIPLVDSDKNPELRDDSHNLLYTHKYEVGLDPDLAQFFPPFPINGTAFVMNGVEYPSVNLWGKERGAYLVTETAIYWKGEDPLIDAAFYLTRGAFPSSSFVTSIKAAKDSGIKIRQEGTTDIANTGNLVIDAQIPIEKTNPGLGGYMVPKDVVNNKLIFGPVVSSLSVGPGLSISSLQEPGKGYGDVTIDLDSTAGTVGSFNDIVLHNAKQELVGPFPYIKLLKSDDVASGFTMKMHVPVLLSSDREYKLIFYMSAFGLSNVSQPNHAAGINIQVGVLHDWYPGCPTPTQDDPSIEPWGLMTLKEAQVIGSSSDVYAIPLGTPSSGSEYPGETSIIYKAFDPVLIHNDEMLPDNANEPLRHYLLTTMDSGSQCSISGLRPNSTVAITISRATVAGTAGSTSTNYSDYTGEIGFMNMSWKLVPVS